MLEEVRKQKDQMLVIEWLIEMKEKKKFKYHKNLDLDNQLVVFLICFLIEVIPKNQKQNNQIYK